MNPEKAIDPVSLSTDAERLLGIEASVLIERAVEQLSAEFENSYSQNIISAKQVRAYLLDQWPQITDGAAAELVSVSEVETQWALAQENVRSEVAEFSSKIEPPLSLRTRRALDIATVALVGLMLLGGTLSIYSYFPDSSLLQFLTRPWWRALLTLIITIFALGGLYVLLTMRRGRAEERFQSKKAASRLTKQRESSAKHHIDQIRMDLQARRDRAQNKIVEQSKQAAREFHESRSDASYSTILPEIIAEGLANGIDTQYEVETAAKTKLDSLLEILPSGSIGLAGSRGAGKTTLLKSISDRARSNITNPASPIVVFTSAPVHYEARDFILHVFASLCQRVLEAHQTPEQRNPGLVPRVDAGRSDTPLPAVYGALREVLPLAVRISSLAIGIGVLLLTSGFFLASTSIHAERAERSQVSSVPIQQTRSVEVQRSGNAAVDSAEEKTFVQVLGITPAGLFTLGIKWMSFGFACSFVLLILRGHLARGQSRRDRAEFERERRSSRDPLVARARDWLEELRFQQSFSSGWSGSLKLPIGLEGGINNAVSLSKNQYTLPEIARAFEDFVGLISGSRRVIVEIDELDKIDSYEAAQRFMNDIKMIFGLPNCFYLISVSENALSAFERRGLPFRDAFDSSFDAMIHVDYLRREQAFLLIRRRVIGLPVPFLAFCYALSGGLPRDLIRTCREIFAQAKASGSRDLYPLCSSIVVQDLESKIRGTVRSVSDEMGGRGAAWPLPELRKLQENLSSPERILEVCAPLMEAQPKSQSGTSVNDAKEGAGVPPKIRTAVQDLGVYAYFSATLLGLLRIFEMPESWNEPARGKTLEYADQIARSRQEITTSIHVSIDRISGLRKLTHLPIPSFVVDRVDHI
jgi:hypothetical protein